MAGVRGPLLALAVAGAPSVVGQPPRDYVATDARFMQAMIVAQTVEIRMMRRWLTERDEPTSVDGHRTHAAMPGMLTPAELEALAGLDGPAFDDRFLEHMIRHHEGALTMVEALFAEPGGGREPLLWEFATEVERTQRAEIDLMRRLRR
jgi:uncharacterized protein (DUF305 family)